MNHPSLSLLLLLATGPALAPPAEAMGLPGPVQDELSPAELDELLQERAQRARELPVEDIWREASELAYLVGDVEGAPFDAAVDRGLENENMDARGILLLASTRLFGEEVDWELWSQALLPLLGGESEVALGAAQLLASPDLQTQGSAGVRANAAQSLADAADEGDLGPELRVQCAVAGHRIGLGEHKSRTQRVLYGFLRSADPSLRGQGALAMASLGLVSEVPEVEAELTRMAAVPGAQGRLAAAYIKEQETRRYMTRQLQRERDRSSAILDREKGSASPDLLRVDKTIETIRQRHLEGDKVTREELVEAAINGMLQSMDPHSSYFPPVAYTKFEQDIEAEYGGIGAYVGVDRQDNIFTITRPIYSGPAYEADLRTDDKIVRIGDWPTIGEEVDDIIKRLKGKPGTDVKLYVWREGMDPTLIERPTEDMAVSVTRARISIPPAHSDYLPGDIGLVELNTFNRVASIELINRIQEFQERGMKGLVLDLRNNTGGLLSEAVNVADIFLPKGKRVVSTENRVERSNVWSTRMDPLVPEDLPVVVLINRFSASAAEIVSGALQDHGRAVLVGERSFGKGSVQNLIPMPGEADDQFADENRNGRRDNWEGMTKDWNGNGEFDFAPRIKLTIERYLLPTGRSIHRELDDEGNIVSSGGVSPDKTVRAKRWDQWRLEEMLRVQRTRKIREWAKQAYPANRDLFAELAIGDQENPMAYPGFQQLREDLETILPDNDLRYLMRQEVRRLVQDARGEAFPFGDYQDDLQLQEAIRTLLEKGGRTGIEDIVAYASTFEDRNIEQRASAPPETLAQRKDNLDQALALIAEAEGTGGALSPESLRELSDLLEGIKKQN